MRPRLVAAFTDGSSDSECNMGGSGAFLKYPDNTTSKHKIVGLLLRPSRKGKWGSLKKSYHLYSPLELWENHVPTSRSLPMLTSKGTRWCRFPCQ
ncbi:hypothetical protein TNCV_2870561 [Trichonephila clavipes]|nr:hypothetical protein TNCV_2870561 [Trichonephila clavipes]